MTSRAKQKACRLALIGLMWLCGIAQYGAAQVSVLTQHNDNGRTGQNLNETVLNTSNVNVSNFGRLFFRTVDQNVYAQPLYVANLNIGGRTRNVLFVATENNSVYAFDADDPLANTPLWRVNLGTPVPSQDVCQVTPMPEDGCQGQYWGDVGTEIGITGTPVIDPATNTLYVVAKTKDVSSSTWHFYLHALDLLSGEDKFAGPVEIAVPSNAPVQFVQLNQLQRPGLLLLDGTVYVMFGSAGDYNIWHGWVMAYDASTLQQLAYFITTPSNEVFDPSGETGGGGIFAAGGPVADNNGNIYVMTGNGPFDNSTNFGVSALKLNTPQLSVQDYFTPHNASYLGSNNVDLGSGGLLMIPGTSLLVGGGKDGYLRLIDGNNMGKFNASTDNNLQNFSVTSGWIFGTPTFWNGPGGQWVYLWVSGGLAEAYKFNGSTTAPALQTSPISQGGINSPSGEVDTSPMSLSASGSQAGTGILWAPIAQLGGQIPGVTGVLHALDASNLSTDLWNSELNSNRDRAGNFAKFNPPTVANGKVYLPTFSGQVIAYGLNPPSSPGIYFVQEAITNSNGSSQVGVSFPGAQTAGDLNVVVVGWADNTSSVVSVSDSQGNPYALAAGPTAHAGLTQAIYYAKNISGGNNAVTVKLNAVANFPELRIFEYAGADPSNPVDQSVAAAGASATADSGPATTTAPNELIFAADTVQGGTGYVAEGDPFVPRLVTSTDVAEDRVVDLLDTYDATAVLSNTGTWIMQMVTFKAQGSGTPNFSLSASPNSATVSPGSSVNTNIPVSGVNGFSGAVTLSCSNPPTGVSCSFDPPSVVPGSEGGTSALTISAASGTAASTYNLTVSGVSESINETTSVSLTVQASTAPDFSVSAASPVMVSAGASVTSKVSITAVNGFNSAVSLACSSGLPAGAACSFNPASVTGAGSSTLNVATAATTPVGGYPITVMGTSGALANPASMTLTVTAAGSFALSAPNPATATVTAGSAATFTTTITPSGAFAGTVTLSCSVATSASPAPTCASTSVQLSGSAVQANITVNTTAPHASVMRSTSIFYALLLPIGGITLLGVGFGSRRRKRLGILLIFLTVSGLLLFNVLWRGQLIFGWRWWRWYKWRNARRSIHRHGYRNVRNAGSTNHHIRAHRSIAHFHLSLVGRKRWCGRHRKKLACRTILRGQLK